MKKDKIVGMGNYWLDLAFSPKLYLIELLEDAGCTVKESSLFAKVKLMDVFLKNTNAFSQITEGTWKNKKKKEIKMLAEKIIADLKGKQIP